MCLSNHAYSRAHACGYQTELRVLLVLLQMMFKSYEEILLIDMEFLLINVCFPLIRFKLPWIDIKSLHLLKLRRIWLTWLLMLPFRFKLITLIKIFFEILSLYLNN